MGFRERGNGDCFWGEDLFMDQCLSKVLGVTRENDFRLLVEDHCDAPSGWRSCTDSSKATFHPFKTVWEYQECLVNAGGKLPKEISVTTSEPPSSSSTAKTTTPAATTASTSRRVSSTPADSSTTPEIA